MRVEELLEEEGVWYRVIDKSRMSDDIDDVVKTIILKVGEDFYAFCVKTDQLVDWDKIKNYFDTGKARMADADEVKEHSNSPPGGCCPLLVDCPVYFDPSIKDLEKVHMGSGVVDKGLEMKTKDLIRLVDPEFLDVSKPK